MSPRQRQRRVKDRHRGESTTETDFIVKLGIAKDRQRQRRVRDRQRRVKDRVRSSTDVSIRSKHKKCSKERCLFRLNTTCEFSR